MGLLISLNEIIFIVGASAFIGWIVYESQLKKIKIVPTSKNSNVNVSGSRPNSVRLSLLIPIYISCRIDVMDSVFS